VTLFAPDGYWRDVTEQVISRGYSPGASYLAPYPRVSSGQVFGDQAITNDGDIEAWPTWTVVGPLEQFTATNLTTGQTFTLTTSLAAGQTVTITTLRPTVRGPNGDNLAGGLNWPQAYLWPLLPGDNRVSFAAAGADVGTAINLAFHPRFEGW
jgi:hypothetical protein